MITICDSLKCTGCGACVQSCPQNCIEMEKNTEGFAYPIINQELCINCKKCVKICPNNHSFSKFKSQFYMAWHKNRDVIMNSSSGGVFTALAQIIFSRGGIVFGGELNPVTHDVVHVPINSEKELYRIRLSKYYQSDTSKIYNVVVKQLKLGKYVLFSGTACQIAGLLSIVGPDKNRLITVEVLCHGVTSKFIVDRCIESKEKHYKKKIKQIFFRVKGKDLPWQGGSRMKLVFDDNSSVVEDKNSDTFFKGFNESLFLRESCYRCSYCGTERIADFTIADFWGIKKGKVDKQQEKDGVSLMLVNSLKAREILLDLKNLLYIEPIEEEEAIPYNHALVEPNTRPSERDYFFSKIYNKGFDPLIKHIYWWFYFKQRVKKILLYCVGKKNFNKIITVLRK